MKTAFKKGQISIDLIMIILVIVVALGGLTMITASLSTTQEKINIHQELERSALKISNAIIYAKTLDGTTFEIIINLPKIRYKKLSGNQLVSVTENEVTITETISGENITVVEKTNKPDWMQVTTTQTQVVIQNA